MCVCVCVCVSSDINYIYYCIITLALVFGHPTLNSIHISVVNCWTLLKKVCSVLYNFPQPYLKVKSVIMTFKWTWWYAFLLEPLSPSLCVFLKKKKLCIFCSISILVIVVVQIYMATVVAYFFSYTFFAFFKDEEREWLVVVVCKREKQ